MDTHLACKDFVPKFTAKKTKILAENPALDEDGNLGAKLKLLNTHDLLCCKFAPACRKMQLSTLRP